MKKTYILTVAFFLCLCSCKKDGFLGKAPYDKIVTENVIINFATFDAAAKGVYDFFQDATYYDSYTTLLPDLMADNVKNNDYTVFSAIDKYQTNADDAYVKAIWDRIPKVIAQSSVVIRKAEQFDFGPDRDKATKIVGQLYVARALAYFDLQRFFAQPYNYTADASHLGVPLVDEALVGVEILSPARSTTKQVYAKIVADLLKGISLIGDDIPSPYYLNKNSAKAILAKVYLYMGNWSEASRLADEVIGDNRYSLIPTGSYVNSWTLASTTESIFSISNTATDNAALTSITNFYKFPRYSATSELYNSFSASDVRRNLISAGTFKVLKYAAVNNDNNVSVIRLSEMFLIKAESLVEIGGAENEALALIALNRIRLRADPTAVSFQGSGDVLKDAIQKERRKELMFEGNRLFDLTRKKKSFIKYSTSVSAPININYPNNFTIFPIPQIEIDANPNISSSQQNPGYNR